MQQAQFRYSLARKSISLSANNSVHSRTCSHSTIGLARAFHPSKGEIPGSRQAYWRISTGLRFTLETGSIIEEAPNRKTEQISRFVVDEMEDHHTGGTKIQCLRERRVASYYKERTHTRNKTATASRRLVPKASIFAKRRRANERTTTDEAGEGKHK